MRSVVTLLLALLGVGFWPAASRADDPAPPRQHELIDRLRHDCGSCHGLTLKGGLGPPLLPAQIADKPDDYLVDVILFGIPRTAMPPWEFEINRGEAEWLVRHMKRGLER